MSESLYLRDPDGNGVELYRDRPQDEWPRNADGSLAMYTRRLDLPGLLREAPGHGSGGAAPEAGEGPKDL